MDLLAIRNRLHNNAGFFAIAWAFHYFPFYLMNRQLFLHHYLPAHLASALVAGSVVNFIITESIEFPISIASHTAPVRRYPRTRTDIGIKGIASLLVFVVALVSLYLFMAPLTYGASSYVLSTQSRAEHDLTVVHPYLGLMASQSTDEGYSTHGHCISRQNPLIPPAPLRKHYKRENSR
jgi:dolichyl-phosphate-mannose--protein O-mannosyl transferase